MAMHRNPTAGEPYDRGPQQLEQLLVARITEDLARRGADAPPPERLLEVLAGVLSDRRLSEAERALLDEGRTGRVEDPTDALIAMRIERAVAAALELAGATGGEAEPPRVVVLRDGGGDAPPDATLPAGQPVLVRDWRAKALFGAEQALVPAARLVDGEFVTLHEAATMTVYDIEFDTPHVLYVDGLEVASHMAECAVPVTKR